ncbi:hypothetical protein ACVW0J_010418 [Bradyrhizobium sp. i1.7.7]
MRHQSNYLTITRETSSADSLHTKQVTYAPHSFYQLGSARISFKLATQPEDLNIYAAI